MAEETYSTFSMCKSRPKDSVDTATDDDELI